MASGKTSSLLKDFASVLLVLGVLLGGLYAYSGVWPPAVIVESGSMMHRDDEVSYGRVGTIDPGDLVLVKAVDGRADVTTWAGGGRDRYGEPGDVVVFYPENDRERTPIIHRAMTWVTVESTRGDARAYHVEWSASAACPSGSVRAEGGCAFGPDGITIPALGLDGYRPARSGLITKGDNPVSNGAADQVAGISRIVEPEWIVGKARGEIPWLGLIKLAVAPEANEDSPPEAWVRIGNAFAPKDLWVMLGASLLALVGIPFAFDAFRALFGGSRVDGAGGRR